MFIPLFLLNFIVSGPGANSRRLPVNIGSNVLRLRALLFDKLSSNPCSSTVLVHEI